MIEDNDIDKVVIETLRFKDLIKKHSITEIEKIIIDVEDSISGIEPKEKSFIVKLNGNRLFCAYQPVKKQITYEFERGMNEGDHLIDIIVKDKVGNKTNKSISFTCK